MHIILTVIGRNYSKAKSNRTGKRQRFHLRIVFLVVASLPQSCYTHRTWGVFQLGLKTWGWREVRPNYMVDVLPCVTFLHIKEIEVLKGE